MKIWYIDDQARLAAERAAVDNLAANADWLAGYNWRFESGLLVLDVEIAAHGATYVLVMYYPPTYPETPPYVKPKDSSESISGHQYGDGTLCLEWGPDTWTPQLTGVQLLESTQKLLQTENPRGAGEREPVPSRHHLTMGQEIRTEGHRLWVEPSVLTFFEALEDGATGTIKSIIAFGGEATVALLQSVTVAGGPTWSSDAVPERLSERTMSWMRQGVFLKTGVGNSLIESLSKSEDLELLLQVALPSATISVKEGNYGIAAESTPALLLLVGMDNQLCVYRPKSGKPEVLDRFVGIKDSKGEVVRSPDADALLDKKVAIVGLGSVGSKVALSLARAGVGNFVLVDDDILLPSNLVRHTGDWMDVCQHKVDGVKDAIERIRRNIKINVHRSNLTAQESNSQLNKILGAIGGCDLIVDATASSAVFNTLSAVAATYSKPVVWCEVFAGGIGGLIARSRPDLDPTPQEMRAQFHAYTADCPVMEPQTIKDYAVIQEDGAVFTASDSDVEVIAAHTSRLVLDTLLRSTASIFPCSMYLIGLAKGWIFTTPFETIPLDVGLPQKSSPEVVSEDTMQSNLEFIRSLLPK